MKDSEELDTKEKVQNPSTVTALDGSQLLAGSGSDAFSAIKQRSAQMQKDGTLPPCAIEPEQTARDSTGKSTDTQSREPKKDDVASGIGSGDDGPRKAPDVDQKLDTSVAEEHQKAQSMQAESMEQQPTGPDIQAGGPAETKSETPPAQQAAPDNSEKACLTS